MITLDILDASFDVFTAFLLRIPIISNTLDTFSNLLNELSWVTIPTFLVNIFTLCRLFLPTGTIAVLFTVTCLLIGISLVSGLIYFFVHLGNIL